MSAVATISLMTTEHLPVLAPQLLELLAPAPGETAVDCTVGGAGHARMVAEHLGPQGTLVGIDRDPGAEGRFESLQGEFPGRLRFIRGDYAEGLEGLLGEGIRADMVYLDLGMSSLQLDAWEWVFSYSYDAPLDMRMDPQQEFSAADLV